jgi:hypothetical protein
VSIEISASRRQAARVALALLVLIFLTLEAAAQTEEKQPYSPYVGRDFPTNVYFGDTHLHTRLSLDGYGDGNTKNGPSEAYRWAKGETLAGDDGVPTRISKPLDFLMIADHAEYMGVVPALAEGNKLLRATEAGARWGKMMDDKDWGGVFTEFILDATKNTPRIKEAEFEKSVWDEVIDAAEAHNQPGKFTAFIGYEYSPFPDGDNLHHVVVFRDGKAKAEQVKPFSAFDSENPEDLWTWLQAYEDKTGGDVLAISHNGNLSGGNMFALQTFEGNPLTREYAEKRMRWEPLTRRPNTRVTARPIHSSHRRTSSPTSSAGTKPIWQCRSHTRMNTSNTNTLDPHSDWDWSRKARSVTTPSNLG